MKTSGPQIGGLRARLNRCLRSMLCMVLVALALRLAVMVFQYPEQLNPVRDHFRFGFEIGRVARSIVQGKGFGNPLFEDTGPSAWMAPVYTYLLAGVFKLFGTYTKASAVVMLSINCAASALNCLPVYFMARKSFGDRVGLWSGWAWAFFPYGIYFPSEMIWPTTVATLMVSLLFMMVLYLADTDRLTSWILYGLLWGVTALTEPGVVSILPFISLWACYRLYRDRKRWFPCAVTSSLAFFLVVGPWLVRDYLVFHQFVPIRDNLGLELCDGNSADNSYLWNKQLYPGTNRAEGDEFKRVGELNYMADKKNQGMEFIRTHRPLFLKTTVRRIVYTWTNFWSVDFPRVADEPLDRPNIFFCTLLTILAVLGFRRAYRASRAATIPYAIALFTFPLVYYVTHNEMRYRRPIDPLMVVLATIAIASWRSPKRAILG
ncbi:MAG TPA: glycosyltransferase family 39 protein [Terriglobales bacterium]|nr:glycosyltransferase family 39 protein [Terriglobales bacterium]